MSLLFYELRLPLRNSVCNIVLLMIPIDDIVLQALTGVYGTGITGIDLFKYSPAQIAPFFSERFQVDGALGVFRDLGMFVSIILVGMFAFILAKWRVVMHQPMGVASSGEDTGALPVPNGPLRKPWEKVLSHLDSPREADWKLAVIEADKLADLALAKADIPGAGMGERLINLSPGTLSSLDGLWWAHKVRNRLAHELDYFLRYTEAKQAVVYYEQALNELNAI